MPFPRTTSDSGEATPPRPRPFSRVRGWLRRNIVLVAAACGVARSRAAALWRPSRVWGWLRRNIVLVIVFLGLVLTYATLKYPEVFTARPEAQSDGVYYYSWARSLALDGDIDMSNDYPIIGNPGGFGVHPKTKHVTNMAPMGTGLFQVPTVWLARGVLPLTNWLGWTRDNLRGGGMAFQRIAQSASPIWGFFGIVLGIRLARRFVPDKAALAGGLGVLLASPLLWYMLRQPYHSHAIDSFAVALFVFVWWRTYGNHRLWRWLLVGAFLGSSGLVRPQNVCHGIIVAFEGVWLAATSLRTRKSLPRWFLYWLLRGLLFAVGYALAFSPQIMAWRYMYGSFFLIPQGGTYMVWDQSRWGGFLFSARFGLFAWHPLLSLGVLGLLVPLFRRGTPALLRHLSFACLIGFAAHTYINGVPEDWWGHWSFGGRRGAGSMVYLTVGLSFAMHGIAVLLARWSVWLVRAAPFVLLSLCAWFNLSLMDDYLYSRAKHEVTQPMKPLWTYAFAMAVDAIYGVTGNWGSIPDSWPFAVKARVSPERYDMATALDFDPGGQSFSVPLSSPNHAMGGFSETTAMQGHACRWIDGDTGRWVYVLRRPTALKGTVTMAPAHPGTKVRMRIGGKVVLDAELAPDFHDYPISIPKSLSSGVVVVAVEQQVPKAPVSWPLGRTPLSLPYEVELESAGFGTGSRATLNLGPSTRVEIDWGLHLFVLDPVRPSTRRWEHFDTQLSAAEVARFAAVVDALPMGTVTAVAVAYDASAMWSAVGDRALAALGGTSSLLGKNLHGYALLGAKGATPGTASEAIQDKAPARVLVGRTLAERHDGVAYDHVVLTPDPQGK